MPENVNWVELDKRIQEAAEQISENGCGSPEYRITAGTIKGVMGFDSHQVKFEKVKVVHHLPAQAYAHRNLVD